MTKNRLRYQPIINTDGTISIHETIIDSENTLLSVSYIPVKLEATSLSELQNILRQVYRHMASVKPLTIEELDNILSDNNEDNYDDNVIDLVDFIKGKR